MIGHIVSCHDMALRTPRFNAVLRAAYPRPRLRPRGSRKQKELQRAVWRHLRNIEKWAREVTLIADVPYGVRPL